MRYTNNGRVRVEATSVQHGADANVKLWHGRDKLWPPATPQQIRAVEVTPDVFAPRAVNLIDPMAWNTWALPLAKHIIDQGGSLFARIGLSKYMVERIEGNTIYFADKIDANSVKAAGNSLYIYGYTDSWSKDFGYSGFSTDIPFYRLSSVFMELTNMPFRYGVIDAIIEFGVIEKNIFCGFATRAIKRSFRNTNVVEEIDLWGLVKWPDLEYFMQKHPAPDSFSIRFSKLNLTDAVFLELKYIFPETYFNSSMKITKLIY